MSEGPRDSRPHPDPVAELSDDERSFEELRSLLLSSEQREIVALRERLNDPGIRAREMSEVIAEALRLGVASGNTEEVSGALTPAVEHSLKESVRKNAATLAQALYPVMGPAIRKSIYESIRSLIQSFNESLTQGLSIRGIRWRLEALRTGRPFAEVVLLHTLVFRVEQIFLIHKKAGLLLQHLSSPSVGVQDPDMVSSMLSAIQDFVRDSFSAGQGESLHTLQVGDLQVWVEQGPDAILAAVVRGHAPQRLRFKLRERLEQIHLDYGAALDAFEGDAAPFQPTFELLADCLESQEGKEEGQRVRPYLLVLAGLAAIMIVAWGTHAFIQNRRWSHFVEDLRQQPGVVVTSFAKRGGLYRIQGLRDPLAPNPAQLAEEEGLKAADADFHWRPYYSLDDAMVLRRAREILQPPPGVSLSARNGTLRLQGKCQAIWLDRVQELSPLIPGVLRVDAANLNGLGPLGLAKASLESLVVMFGTGQNSILPDQQAKVEQAVSSAEKVLAKAAAIHEGVVIELVGHTDATGTESTNSQLSDQRAQNVLTEMLQAGIPRDFLRPHGVSSTEPVRTERSDDDRRYNRSVTFRVVESTSGKKH